MQPVRTAGPAPDRRSGSGGVHVCEILQTLFSRGEPVVALCFCPGRERQILGQPAPCPGRDAHPGSGVRGGLRPLLRVRLESAERGGVERIGASGPSSCPSLSESRQSLSGTLLAPCVCVCVRVPVPVRVNFCIVLLIWKDGFSFHKTFAIAFCFFFVFFLCAHTHTPSYTFSHPAGIFLSIWFSIFEGRPPPPHTGLTL